MILTLAQKQALDATVTGGVECYYMSYDPRVAGTSSLESNAASAGYTSFQRVATASLVEVIFTRSHEVVIRTANQQYSKGSYSAYMGMWYSYQDPTFNEGDEYDCNIAIQPSTFPNNSVITWRTPNTVSPVGVYGFLHWDYGNYQGGTVPVGITPAQIYTLTDLRTTFNFDYTGTIGDDGVLEEFWATSAARPNTNVDMTGVQVYEIGRMRRSSTSTIAFHSTLTQLGTFNDGTRDWKVGIGAGAVPYILAMPTTATAGSTVQGDVPWMPYLSFIMQQGIITGNEWFNGVGCGPEPTRGSGTVTCNVWSASHAFAARVPITTTNLVASAASTTSVQLSYASPGSTSVEYRMNGGTATAMPGNKTITGLTSNTAYTFEVRGTNGTGVGAWSNVANVTTLESAPIQANYITNQDITSSYWGKVGYTVTAPDLLTETSTGSSEAHRMAPASDGIITRTAGVKTFVAYWDVELVASGPTKAYLQMFDSSFTSMVMANFNVDTSVLGYVTTTGAWSNPVASIQTLPSGKKRCKVEFTTDASTTGLYLAFRGPPGDSNDAWTGTAGKSIRFSNFWLYNKNAGAGGA